MQKSKQTNYLEEFKFCPKCGRGLEPAMHDGQVMPTCSNKKCKFIFWQNSKPCVVAIIEDGEGRVLMTVRGIEPDMGKLDFPGGFMKLGELPEEATIREIKEELGIDVELESFFDFAIDKYFYQGIWETTITVAFKVKVKNGNIGIADKNEVAELVWLDPNDFSAEELAFECNERFLNKLKRKAL